MGKQNHRQRLLVGYAKQAEREAGADDEAARHPNKPGEHQRESGENHEEQIVEWGQDHANREASPQEMRGRDNLHQDAGQHGADLTLPRTRPHDALPNRWSQPVETTAATGGQPVDRPA